MNNYKSKFFVIPLFIWLSLTLIDSFYFIRRDISPIYWRAWEYVANQTGSNVGITRFKPWSSYHGKGAGDLMYHVKFFSRENEKMQQDFIVDEYGYRNSPGFLNKKIDAVIFGTSQVVGGAESQQNTISEILTRDYHIRTYNSFQNLQMVYDDKRYVDNTPHYIIHTGSDYEIYSSHSSPLQEHDKSHMSITKKWNSYESWKKNGDDFPHNYNTLIGLIKSYSFVRFVSIQMSYKLMDSFLPRSIISKNTPQDVFSYDDSSQTIFWNKPYEKITMDNGVKRTIDIAVKNIKKSQEILAKRGIKLIIVSVPVRDLSENPKFKDVDPDKTTIQYLNRKLQESDVDNINMYPIMLKERKNNQSLRFYHWNDSHWNSYMDHLIAENIARYIQQHK